MSGAVQRLRARRARRLVTRFSVAGGVLVLGYGTGWAAGLSVSTTVATLCIGMPVMALFHHYAIREHGRRRMNDGRRLRPIQDPFANCGSLARGRKPGQRP